MNRLKDKQALGLLATVSVGVGLLSSCSLVGDEQRDQTLEITSTETSTPQPKEPGEAQPSKRTTAPSSQESPPPSQAQVTAQANEPELEVANSWAKLAQEFRSGVAHIEATTCAGDSWSGSGFSIDSEYLVTAAHVAEQASVINVGIGDLTTSAIVIGRNPGYDIALLKLKDESTGYSFDLDHTATPIGTEVAVLGYPLVQASVFDRKSSQDSLKITSGLVSGVKESIHVGSHTIPNVIQTDAVINSGNSGGPVIAKDGSLVGLVSAVQREDSGSVSVDGTGFAIPSKRLSEAVTAWKARDIPEKSPECGDAGLTTDATVQKVVTSRHDHAESIAQALQDHGTALSTGNYSEAFNFLSPSMQQRSGGLEQWSAGLHSTSWISVEVEDVETVSVSAYKVRATIETHQAPEDAPNNSNQTCSLWSISYDFLLGDSKWTIERAIPLTDLTESCED